MRATYKFILGRKATAPLALELQVYKSRECRVYVATRITLKEESQWDDKRQKVIRSANADAINTYLGALQTRIEEAEARAEMEGCDFGKDEIRRAADELPFQSSKVVRDVVKTFQDYNKHDYLDKTIKYPTYQKYTSNLNRLQSFIDIYKGETKAVLSFDELDKHFLGELEVYLQSTYGMETVAKFHRSMKKFVAQAVIDKYLTENPYENFKVKRGHTKVRDVLTWEQLHSLENLDRSRLRATDPRLELVLDKFLISCYCGLRIGDSYSLKKTDVKESSEGLIIDTITEKMQGSHVILPLRLLFDGKGESIIQKYLNGYPDLETVFPAIPDQKVNARLKSLSCMAGIPFNLTFHVARHTCATLLAESTGNPFLIMKILGHQEIRTSMIYIHNSYNAAVNGLKAVSWDGSDKPSCVERANSITNISIQEISELCDSLNFSLPKKMVILGTLINKLDQKDAIKVFAKTVAGIKMTTDELADRLHMMLK